MKTWMFVLVTLTLVSTVRAEEDVRKKPLFDANHTPQQILNSAKTHGKYLIIKVKNGLSYTAKVKQVGTNAVILTELSGGDSKNKRPVGTQ